MTLEKFRAGYGRVLEWVVIALMAILFLEVMTGVIFRTVGVSLVWYDEVASILLAWLTFYGSALASVKRAHIGCPELVDIAPPRARVAIRTVAQVLTIAFFLLMGWYGYSILGVLESDHLVSIPEIPIAWTQSVVPISAVLIVIAEIVTLPVVIEASRRPKAGAAHGAPAGPVEITGGASQ